MTVLVVLTVIVIVALIAGLAFYLYWAGTLLDRIGAELEGAAELVRAIVADAERIGPGVEHINQTGGVVAGALPPLYRMGAGLLARVAPPHPRPPALPAPRPPPGPGPTRAPASAPRPHLRPASAAPRPHPRPGLRRASA